MNYYLEFIYFLDNKMPFHIFVTAIDGTSFSDHQAKMKSDWYRQSSAETSESRSVWFRQYRLFSLSRSGSAVSEFFHYVYDHLNNKANPEDIICHLNYYPGPGSGGNLKEMINGEEGERGRKETMERDYKIKLDALENIVRNYYQGGDISKCLIVFAFKGWSRGAVTCESEILEIDKNLKKDLLKRFEEKNSDIKKVENLINQLKFRFIYYGDDPVIGLEGEKNSLVNELSQDQSDQKDKIINYSNTVSRVIVSRSGRPKKHVLWPIFSIARIFPMDREEYVVNKSHEGIEGIHSKDGKLLKKLLIYCQFVDIIKKVYDDACTDSSRKDSVLYYLKGIIETVKEELNSLDLDKDTLCRIDVSQDQDAGISRNHHEWRKNEYRITKKSVDGLKTECQEMCQKMIAELEDGPYSRVGLHL